MGRHDAIIADRKAQSGRKMKAALLTAPFQFHIIDRPMPLPAPGEALVRVIRAGICGSDIHIFRGEYARDQLPRVPGHEFAGEVVEVRDPQGEVAIGDLVTADINIGCGNCIHCQTGSPMLCIGVSQIGIHRDGAFAEYVAVPCGNLIVLPSAIEPSVGALLEPLGCVARNLRRSGLRAGQSLLVIGAGPMGMLHVQAAKGMDAGPILILESDPVRADLARRLGADITAVTIEDALKVTEQTDGGPGFDVVIDCVGKTELVEFAVGAARRGGTIGCFGLDRPDRLACLPLSDVVLSEKSLVSSVGASAADMRAALDLVVNAGLDTTPYTGSVFPLMDIAQAFEAFAVRKVALKVQLTF